MGSYYKLFKNDEGNYVFQIWGGSTKHPDLVYHMEDFEMANWGDPNDDEFVKGQIFQWLLEIASKLNYPPHAVHLAQWAMDNWQVWRDDCPNR